MTYKKCVVQKFEQSILYFYFSVINHSQTETSIMQISNLL